MLIERTALVFVCQAYFCAYIEEFAHLIGNLKVVVKEEVPFLLKERCDVIGIILKERRGSVCRCQGLPMKMPPVVMVGYLYLLDITRAGHRNRKRLYPICCCYPATGTQGLLLEVLVGLYIDRLRGTSDLLVPRNWTEERCWQNQVHVQFTIYNLPFTMIDITVYGKW